MEQVLFHADAGLPCKIAAVTSVSTRSTQTAWRYAYLNQLSNSIQLIQLLDHLMGNLSPRSVPITPSFPRWWPRIENCSCLLVWWEVTCSFHQKILHDEMTEVYGLWQDLCNHRGICKYCWTCCIAVSTFRPLSVNVVTLIDLVIQADWSLSTSDAPRFCISAAMPDVTDDQTDAGDINSEIFLEEGIEASLIGRILDWSCW